LHGHLNIMSANSVHCTVVNKFKGTINLKTSVLDIIWDLNPSVIEWLNSLMMARFNVR
jgi:hypothetical protein